MMPSHAHDSATAVDAIEVDDLTVEPYPWHKYPFPIPKWSFFLLALLGISGALYLSIKFSFEWSNNLFPNATRVCP